MAICGLGANRNDCDWLVGSKINTLGSVICCLCLFISATVMRLLCLSGHQAAHTLLVRSKLCPKCGTQSFRGTVITRFATRAAVIFGTFGFQALVQSALSQLSTDVILRHYNILAIKLIWILLMAIA